MFDVDRRAKFILDLTPEQENKKFLEIGGGTGALKKYIPSLILTKELLPNISTQVKYDVIVLSHVLEHLQKPDLAIKNMKEILAQEGIIYIEVPNISGINICKDVNSVEHVNFFSEMNLVTLMTRNGFLPIKMDTGIMEENKTSYLIMAFKKTVPSFFKNRKLLVDIPPGKFCIFGASSVCSEAFSLLTLEQRRNCICVLDNSNTYVGLFIGMKKILKPSYLIEHPNVKVLVASIIHRESITKELLEIYRIPKEKIFYIAEVFDE
jgi:hypothetical protein